MNEKINNTGTSIKTKSEMYILGVHHKISKLYKLHMAIWQFNLQQCPTILPQAGHSCVSCHIHCIKKTFKNLFFLEKTMLTL